ncbi:rfrA pentapeptide repeat-containing protein [Calothrix parasitica NIES-267]|uniref:RfrA pentapeptide repeat-containing protein n=1 Tax=Calothrix parasitica NIES-267 TaxID=1973488 RepID=A0A1Z4LLM2_9CYAN|nr:rfrA pentapeptide repeat-containing protein [Calothrix parasitica NIES-267]
MDIERDEIETEEIGIKELLSRYNAGERNFTDITILEIDDGLLRGIDLSGINLENSDLWADFSGAILRGVNFRYSMWHIAAWEDIDFTGSDFTGIHDAVGCDFIRCNLSNTIWTKAELWQSRFIGCEDATADFSDADFCEVKFFTEKRFFGE